MKKSFVIVCLIVFSTINLFSQELPADMAGIWEGKDRYVFFDEYEENNERELVVVLKEYYGWYLDRAAEPEKYDQIEKRTRNAATHKTAEHIKITEIKNYLSKNKNQNYEKPEDCAWEFCLEYSKNEKNYIPVFIHDSKLYYDFYIKSPVWDNNGKILITNEGQWIEVPETRGFTIDSQIKDQNIGLLLVESNKQYNVRYWLSDMDFSEDSVKFIFNQEEYSVPRHIFICNNNYSSVSGRSKKIRNSVEAIPFTEEDYIFNSQKTVMTKTNSLYLQKLADKKTYEDLITIIKSQNSKRKPDPPALFPEEELDWHWDLIDMLEKDNEIIQLVRERQNQFGKRAKDIKK